MQTFVITTDFVYMHAQNGKQYGWGVARYATPKLYYGDEFTERTYKSEPEESRRMLVDYWKKLLPHADEREVFRVLGVK